MNKEIIQQFRVSDQHHGLRIDKVLTEVLSDYSRSKISAWLKANMILVNKQPARPKTKIFAGDTLDIQVQFNDLSEWTAHDIPIHIHYEDEDIIIINKQPGLVVHPAAGHHEDTLVNALLHHCSQLKQLPRAGLIHRLDKDTSGLLVVAKNLTSHKRLVDDMQQRVIQREYLAIANGALTQQQTISAPIARHPKIRTKMAVVAAGKPATTHVHILENFENHTFLRLKLDTGRTHQIRVHMSHIGFPLVGDPSYGSKKPYTFKNMASPLADSLNAFSRQALHAWRLGFNHPQSRKTLQFEANLPDDMSMLLKSLQKYATAN